MTAKLWLAQDSEADQLLADDPFALLVGMCLDQQIPLEVAFEGPRKIVDRLGGLDPQVIADYNPEVRAVVCTESRGTSLSGFDGQADPGPGPQIVDRYGGDAAQWIDGSPDGAEVLRRLKAYLGSGEQKAKIFLALLGKQYGVTPVGWARRRGRLWQGRVCTCRSPTSAIPSRWIR